MSEEKSNSRISEKSSDISQRSVLIPANNPQRIEDVETSTQTTEDDIGLQYSLSKQHTEIGGIDKEPMFVLVDSSGLSDPSSKELLIRDNAELRDTVLRKYFNKYIKPVELPSTSRDLSIPPHHVKESESKEEVLMVDINLQSENEIPFDENDNDKLSESSLDVHIPSYPGSIRSVKIASETSLDEKHRDKSLREAVDFLHRDHEFLIAAETGNDRILEVVMRTGIDIQAMDHLGRNALHLAVCANCFRAIILLLDAGVNTNVKDNLGMTPLSLCLMRRPSLRVANLLFDYGAKIMPRTDPMDTGLFIQFVMMCVPTPEEERILFLLVEKGAIVNDSEAPGGRQALHFAAMSNNCRLINILVELGANLYLLNHRSQTPAEVARTFRCREAQALLEALELEPESSITTFTTITTFID
ncbi:uncharacterized protein LOC114362645 [Ostrinia furnacalis]|uniref:uncharacterized protein LOC114362645 n=1 Tax=Ostrinia furnacalis TaxID=93504 RepID=UPI00103A5B6F|nr:uncharacterized protein LOC114362645 [Ostrinia furnacalis]